MGSLWQKMRINQGARGSSNLRQYLSMAVLPEMPIGPNAPRMPQEGHKTHRNILTVRPEAWRRLQSMHLILDAYFCKLVDDFANTYISSLDFGAEDEDPETGERLSISCQPWFHIEASRIRRPSNIGSVTQWITEYPLGTLERALHLSFPQTTDWTFSDVYNNDVDHEIFQYLTWQVRPSVQEIAQMDPAVVVMVQPPWIAGPRDLERFAACLALPPAAMYEGTNPASYAFHSKERMWAKLWDLCFRQRCRWFVVTTYWGWVFGAFSTGWSQGFVTDVIRFDHPTPTIMESLVYWFASAMGLEGGWTIPEVPEAVHNVVPDYPGLIPPPPLLRFGSIPPSESSWDCKSSVSRDHLSSAGSDVALQRAVSVRGVEDMPMLPPPLPGSPTAPRQRVLNWQLSTIPEGGYPPYAPSESSIDTSTSTVKDFTEEKIEHGNWLSAMNTGLRMDVQ